MWALFVVISAPSFQLFLRIGKRHEPVRVQAFGFRQQAHQLGGCSGTLDHRLIDGMADPLVVQSLRDMRAEILGRIAAYEAQIAQAKHDLAHLNATLRLFTEPEKQRARYLVSHGFFKKGEIADIFVGQLEADGAMTTRELAKRVMAARKLDVADAKLRNSVVSRSSRRFSLPPDTVSTIRAPSDHDRRGPTRPTDDGIQANTAGGFSASAKPPLKA